MENKDIIATHFGLEEEIIESCENCANCTCETSSEEDAPNLDGVTEDDMVDFEQAMRNLRMEEGYIRQQCQTDLNNFLADVAHGAVQEVTLSILIEAGLATRESVATAIQNHTINEVKALQSNIDEQEEYLNSLDEESVPDLKLRLKSIEITKELIGNFLVEAQKPVEQILAEKDKANEVPENVITAEF